MIKKTLLLFLFTQFVFAQTTYPPQAGLEGSTAINENSNEFVAWATGINVERGYMDISNPDLGFVSHGNPEDALGFPTGSVVSLGDKGNAVLTFEKPIFDGPGFDFAVFENGSAAFLELAIVEVSSDGINYFGFPTHSLTQTETQVGSFGTPLAQNLNNIAGKYINGYGTPFDLSEVEDNPLLDKQNVTHVKVIDVVGSINPLFGTFDSFGNLINESYPTPFASGGFDLQAVGVINQVSVASNTNHNKLNIKVYPNPVSNILNIQSEKELTNIEIFNVQGQKILNTKNVESVDVSFLSSGIYLLKVQGNNQSSLVKFIKK